MAAEANAEKALFLVALEKAPGERAAFLDQTCAGDGVLRQRVEALLRAHDQPDSLLDQPAVEQLVENMETTPPVVPDSGPPLPADAGVVRALASGLPRVQLREPDGETDTQSESAGIPEAAPAEARELPARYKMAGEIARGGMGAVLRGRDTELGRDIAVKVLLETHAGRTELVQRFVDEAQIAGQLQHPGIAPVYDMGTSSGKRPYFTMKLVKGQTLAKLLAERNVGPVSNRPETTTAGCQPAPQDRLRLLKVFEQVCQTLAYAHARGVIHRDLKPANIMVGAFGEVQVMAWGLAKVLVSPHPPTPSPKEGEEEPMSIILPLSQRGERGLGSEGHTQAGTAMGTPAYMSPEQARGEVDRIDERADVFGLGALLCHILTGKPPFPGKSTEAMRQAKDADLVGALTRLDACGADEELTALAKRCLAAAPEDRPRNAGEVAGDMTAYLESVETRLRQAELSRVEAQARASEERKRRRVTLALAVSVLVTLVLGGGSFSWWWMRRSAMVQDVETALADAHNHMDQARWSEARAALERAAGRLGEGGPKELHDRLRQARADVAIVAELDETCLRQSSAVKDNFFDLAAAEPLYAESFRSYGLDLSSLERAEARLRASAVREALLVALHDWAAITRDADLKQRLNRLLEQADDDDWRRRFRSLRADKDTAGLTALARREDTLLQPAIVLHQLGQTLVAVKLPEEAARLWRLAQRRHPADFWINQDLGQALLRKDKEESVRFLTVAVALRPDSPGTRFNLGKAMSDQGRVDEATRWAPNVPPGPTRPHGGSARPNDSCSKRSNCPTFSPASSNLPAPPSGFSTPRYAS
jgi:serine/threonine protein kinase